MGFFDGFGIGTALDLGMNFLQMEKADDRQSDAQGFNAAEAEKNRAFNSSEASAQREWSAQQAAITRDFNAQEAERQRQYGWDTRRSAYQDAVADLKAAGLNPMLALRQGAAQPAGGMASSSGPSGATASGTAASSGISSSGLLPLSGSIATASQIAVNEASADKIRADTDKTKAEQKEIEARTPTHGQSIKESEARIENIGQQIRQSRAQIEKIIQETSTSAYSAANLAQQTQNLQAVLPQIKATVENLRSQTQLNTAMAGRTHEETNEIRQRISANLPALQAALGELERNARVLAIPGQEQSRAVNDSFIGSLGAVLRALNPFGNILPNINLHGAK